METSLKPGFAQIFSCCPKLGGGGGGAVWGCSPPRPPGPFTLMINSVRSVVCSPPMSSTFCFTMGGGGGGFFCPGCRRRMDTLRRSSASKYSTTATMLTVSPVKPNSSSLLSPFDESQDYQDHI